MTKDTPTPGSDDAIKQGCICPVRDNNNGNGYMGQHGIFVYSPDCPLHKENAAFIVALEAMEAVNRDFARAVYHGDASPYGINKREWKQ